MDKKTLLTTIPGIAYHVAGTALKKNLITTAVLGRLQIFYKDTGECIKETGECILDLHVIPNGQRCPVKETTKRLNQRARRLATMPGGESGITLSSDSDRKLGGAVQSEDLVFVYSSGGDASAFADEAVLLVALTKARVLSKDTLALQGRLSAISPKYNEHLDQLLRACNW